MHDQLEALIARLEGALRSSNESRPLFLHWSDVELLRALSIERRERQGRLDRMANRMSAILDEELRRDVPIGDSTNPFQPRPTPGMAY